jgi:hypothetical protein
MNHLIIVAAGFILATVAVAVLSPFEDLPQLAPREATQETAAAPPVDIDVTDESGSYDDVPEEIADSYEAGDSQEPAVDDVDSSAAEDSYARGPSADPPIDWPDGEAPPR